MEVNMGGRGSSSASAAGRGVGSNGAKRVDHSTAAAIMADGSLSDAEKLRTIEQEILVNKVGFTNTKELDRLPLGQVASYADALAELESQYGAVGEIKTVDWNDDIGTFQAVKTSGGTLAYVASAKSNAKMQYLAVNWNAGPALDKYNTVEKLISAQKKAEESGWSMPTGGSDKQRLNYTIVHEYGHLLHNTIYENKVNSRATTQTKAAWLASQKRSIMSDAKKIAKQTGLSAEISQYGAKKASEFFAEAFANAHLGKPTAVGHAMLNWLAKNK